MTTICINFGEWNRDGGDDIASANTEQRENMPAKENH